MLSLFFICITFIRHLTMKVRFLIALLIVMFTTSCVREKDKLTKQLHFCQSVLPYHDGLLIANFGSDDYNPLNNEGKGYIAFHQDGLTSILIPADGTLSAPKGMAVKDDFLFVADVNKVVVYNLKNSSETPQIIPFPEDNVWVSDVEIVGNVLLASVTNTGNIYALDIAHPAQIDVGSLAIYAVVPGASALLVSDYHLFIGSSAMLDLPTESTVIYMIDDITNPVIQRVTHRSGSYEGLALSADREALYFSDKSEKILGKFIFATGEIEILPTKMTFDAPTHLDWYNGKLSVADVTTSTVWLLEL